VPTQTGLPQLLTLLTISIRITMSMCARRAAHHQPSPRPARLHQSFTSSRFGQQFRPNRKPTRSFDRFTDPRVMPNYCSGLSYLGAHCLRLHPTALLPWFVQTRHCPSVVRNVRSPFVRPVHYRNSPDLFLPPVSRRLPSHRRCACCAKVSWRPNALSDRSKLELMPLSNERSPYL